MDNFEVCGAELMFLYSAEQKKDQYQINSEAIEIVCQIDSEDSVII